MKAPARNGNGAAGASPSVVHCAIYTRKSTDEGLDRDFNSLDAQREAGRAYVKSQAGSGWVLLPDQYDDGGYSGGTLERPALQRLLGDIGCGRINKLLVYKIDRLSRSLLDFSRLAEIFEKHSVGIVSVTQQLDTSTSMGRLTLNMLLSFAQFEREMVSDRTRDKAHAAKRRGKFIGGLLPLGYDRHPDGGKLVVNKAEAKRVCEIFRLFLELRSLTALAQELARRGWTLKAWTTKGGREFGGGALDVLGLRRLLTNHVYVGKVQFDGQVYAAEHEAIVDQATWDRVQEVFTDGERGPRRPSTKTTALLGGILRCAACDSAMTPTFSQKGRTRYRYYLCNKAHKRGWATCPSPSIPAVEIEKFVLDRIRAIGRDPELVARTIEEAGRQLTVRRSELESEAKEIRKNLEKAHQDLRDAMQAVTGTGRQRRGTPLADREGAIRQLEDRLAAVQGELNALGAQRIDAADLRAALASFDPVWGHLTTPEKARVVQLLIERIDYDGSTGKLALTFRPAGVRTLVAEGPPIAKAAP